MNDAGSSASIVVRWITIEPDSAAIQSLRPLLGALENSRADRFRDAADRDAYIAAHALLRKTLSRFASTAPSDWRFSVAENGKPQIEITQAPSDLHFSLSHTRGLAACAVCRPYAVGIDAEAWQDPTPVELAARFFAPTEAKLVSAQVPAEQRSTFYRLWTLKEAYLKATGQGLAVPLSSFAFTLNPLAIQIEGQVPKTAWNFVEFQPGPVHSLALAVQSPRPIALDAAEIRARDCRNY
jgi:4'-phosphopantetheinyl transferase